MTRTEAEKAADLARYDRTMSVPCPECGALPGERCRNEGEPSNLMHTARILAWARGEL
jgi:hypothetical protein